MPYQSLLLCHMRGCCAIPSTCYCAIREVVVPYQAIAIVPYQSLLLCQMKGCCAIPELVVVPYERLLCHTKHLLLCHNQSFQINWHWLAVFPKSQLYLKNKQFIWAQVNFMPIN